MEDAAKNPALIKSAVEELLRYDSPLETATERYAREDMVIAGQTIPRGALVFAVLASANRDDRQFDRPDVLDIARQDNRHLSFGQGVHYCLGAPLARLEGQIAIGALFSACRVSSWGSLQKGCGGAPEWSSAASKRCRLRGNEACPVHGNSCTVKQENAERAHHHDDRQRK